MTLHFPQEILWLIEHSCCLFWRGGRRGGGGGGRGRKGGRKKKNKKKDSEKDSQKQFLEMWLPEMEWDGTTQVALLCWVGDTKRVYIYIYYVHTWKVPDLEETRRIQLPKCRSIRTTRLMTDTGAMTLLNSRGAVARRRQRDKVTNCPIDHEAKKSVSVGMKRD